VAVVADATPDERSTNPRRMRSWAVWLPPSACRSDFWLLALNLGAV